MRFCLVLCLGLLAFGAVAQELTDDSLIAYCAQRAERLKGKTLYVDFFGKKMPAKFVSASTADLNVSLDGQTLSVPWPKVAKNVYYQLAWLGANNTDEALVAAKYGIAAGLKAEVFQNLEKLMYEDSARAKEIVELQNQVKPEPEKPKAASASGLVEASDKNAGGSTAAATQTNYPPMPPTGWSVMGPGGGGSMYTPTISPHDSKMGLITCDMSGIYLTRDGGKTWRVLPRIRNGRGIAFHPTMPNVIFVGAVDRLHRSDDFGATWHPVTADSQYPMNACWDVCVDPDDGSSVWAAFGRGSIESGMALMSGLKCKIEISQDGGTKFKPASTGLPGGSGMVKKIAVDRSSPVGNRTLYAATSLGFCRSRDHGNSWAGCGKGLPGENLREVTCLYDKTAKKTTVLVLMETGGVYRSEDGGDTFKASGEGLGKKEDGSDVLVNALGASWTDAKIVYACGKNWWKSADAGKTWAKVYEKATKLGSWLTVYKPWSQDGGYGVGCNPKDPNQVWFTGVMQFFSSSDGGATLVEANSHPYPDDAQRTSFTGNDSWQVVKKGPTVFDGGGLEVINCYEVYKDPFQPKTWWAGYADVGGWKTEDDGKSWQYALGYWNHGIKSEWRNSTYAFAFDLKQPGRVYAAQSGRHDLPGKDLEDNDKGVGGVAVSNDNGKTWQPFENNGLPEKVCTSVIVDARDSNTLFAALYLDGVYRSPDAGKHWERVSDGLPSPIRAWRLRQAPDNSIYLLCVNKKPGGVWKLDESSKKWSRVDSSFESVLDLAAGPKGFMAVAVGGTQGGAYYSEDAGKTWKKNYSGEIMSVDFSADKRVWVVGGHRGLFKSLDGGATWSEAADLPFTSLNHVKLNPKNPGEVWLGTGGCGVIKGPVQ